MTSATPPDFRTAIPRTGSPGVDAALVSLHDLSGVSVIRIHGDAATALGARWAWMPRVPGDVADNDETVLCCLTDREWYGYSVDPGAPLPPVAELNDAFAAAGCAAHATDLSHGAAVVRLSGVAAPDTLRKISAIDFRDGAFPNLTVRQTSAARIKTLIARRDEGETRVYWLHANRPFGQYIWDTLLDAAREFGERA